MSERFFFDLPVYRLTEDKWAAEAAAYVHDVVFPTGTLHGDLFRRQELTDPAEHAKKLAQTLHSFTHGPWMFNEIVAYIRLYFLGTQVRGEYFAPERKRIVRSRTRSFQFRHWKLAPEVEIELPLTSETIRSAVETYVSDCARELPRRHIDTTLFSTLSPHIDWLGLFQDNK